MTDFTGFPEIDSALTDTTQTLTLLGSRPGVGKTMLGLQIASNHALRGKRVLYISGELTKRDVLAHLGARFYETSLRSDLANLHIIDPYEFSFAAIREHTGTLVRQTGGVDLIVLDYLDLIVPANRTRSRLANLEVLLANLNGLMREFDTSILLLSQLARTAGDERPILHGSGVLEQAAHRVFMLYSDTEHVYRTLHLAKNRGGAAGLEILLAPNWDTRTFEQADAAVMMNTERVRRHALINDTLRESLSERGITQWWEAPNRNLGGRTPAVTFPEDYLAVMAAAEAFNESFYI